MTDIQPLKGLAKVAVGDLHPNPENPRERMGGGIDELAASMREVGLIQPIVAEKTVDGRLQVIAGHRRLAAAKLLGWSHVAVLIRRDMLPDEQLLTMLIENGQRAGLDPIEEARALRRLQGQLGCTHLELGRRIGRTQGHVSGRLALLNLSVAEREEVRAGHMKLGAAKEMGRIASGAVRPGAKGKSGGHHLGPRHALSTNAKARCRRLGHKGGRTVGGMACGECWESVIRADERDHLHEVSDMTGRCALCSATLPNLEVARATG